MTKSKQKKIIKDSAKAKAKERKETEAEKNASKAFAAFLAVKDNVTEAVFFAKAITNKARVQIAKVREDRTKSLDKIDDVLNRNGKYKKSMAVIKKHIKTIGDINALRYLYYKYIDYNNLPKVKRQNATCTINNLRNRLKIKASNRTNTADPNKVTLSMECNISEFTPQQRKDSGKIALSRLATKWGASIKQAKAVIDICADELIAEAEAVKTA